MSSQYLTYDNSLIDYSLENYRERKGIFAAYEINRPLIEKS